MFLWAGLTALVGSASAQAPAPAAPKAKVKPLVTTVYLVRHAEKDTTGNPPDPALSAVGQVRALALRQTLLKRRPEALFTTDTKRTRATLAPLAEATKLEPQVYDGRRTYLLAERIRKDYAGKSVVVVGHSNTVLPLIEELGGTPPVEEIADSEYDYLFTVRLTEGAMPTVDVRGYGPEGKAKAAGKTGTKTAGMR